MKVAVGGGAARKEHAIFISKIQAKTECFCPSDLADGASHVRLLLFGNAVSELLWDELQVDNLVL